MRRRDTEEITIGGLVNKLKFTQTKRNNEKMAIVTLEDLEGTVDLLVFPKTFKEYGHYLVKDAILFFRLCDFYETFDEDAEITSVEFFVELELFPQLSLS